MLACVHMCAVHAVGWSALRINFDQPRKTVLDQFDGGKAIFGVSSYLATMTSIYSGFITAIQINVQLGHFQPNLAN